MTNFTEALSSLTKLQLSGLPDGAATEQAKIALTQRVVTIFCRLASCVSAFTRVYVTPVQLARATFVVVAPSYAPHNYAMIVNHVSIFMK